MLEVGDACDAMHAASMGWFATLGAWTRDEAPGDAQRLWATASHRHAWHAELWTARRPAIPPVDARPRPAPTTVDATPADRRAAYAEALTALRAELADLRAHTDADLDPATARVIDLVDHDLAELAHRVESL